MARGLYVPVCAALPRHRKLLRLATALELERHEALGLLLDLWVWGLGSADQDGLLPDVEAEDIAAAIDWRGDPDSLVSALLACGFLERDGRGLLIHDWREYGGKVVTERVADRQRKARGRASAASPKESDSTSGGNPAEIRRKSTVDETRQEETRRENIPPPPSCPAGAGRVRPVKADPAITEAFARWYEVYPIHEARAKAEQAWRKLTTDEREECQVLTPAWVEARRSVERQYLPHPASYLNARRWRDDPPANGGGNGRDRPPRQPPPTPMQLRYWEANPDRDPRRPAGASTEDS